jgi:S-adenosylmethionine decarboxylase proenzyme
MDTSSYHYLLEFSGVDSSILDDILFIENTLLNSVRESKATYVNHYFHKFSPQGVSGAVIIAESHISIHTWPESKYAALDVFTCGDRSIADNIVSFLINAFKPEKSKVDYIPRGNLELI